MQNSSYKTFWYANDKFCILKQSLSFPKKLYSICFWGGSRIYLDHSSCLRGCFSKREKKNQITPEMLKFIKFTLNTQNQVSKQDIFQKFRAAFDIHQKGHFSWKKGIQSFTLHLFPLFNLFSRCFCIKIKLSIIFAKRGSVLQPNAIYV